MKKAAIKHSGHRDPKWTVVADLGASYVARMPVETWAALPDHPRQRDTVRHSRKPHWQLARDAQGSVMESLRWVVAADLQGEIFKVDGHARGMLWTLGQLPRPDFVIATVYRCATLEEFYELYTTFDTQEAAETMFDRVTGAYRQHELKLQSKRLRAGTIVDALSIALRGVSGTNEKGATDDIDIYQAVGLFKDELRQLDSVDPQPEVFYTGVVSAALLALALDARHLDYFAHLSRREGSKQAGLLDPIEALLTMIGSLKQRRGTWLAAQQEQLCAAALTGAFAWLQGQSHPQYWVKETLPAADIVGIVNQVRQLKGLKTAGMIT